LKLEKMVMRRAAHAQRRQEKAWAKLEPTPQELYERGLRQSARIRGQNRPFADQNQTMEDEFHGRAPYKRPLKPLYPC
jgi:hypothetical protein